MTDVARGHLPFALWNRTGNQLVLLLLRSPAHQLLDRRLALITVTGRLSGREHTLPVGYKQDGARVRIPVMWPDRKLWWRNLRGGAPVRLRVRGKDRSGRGDVRVDARGQTCVEVLLD
jgi:hypothetical protein